MVHAMRLFRRLGRSALLAVATGLMLVRACAQCPPPTLLQQPADLVIVENTTATFSVVVFGTAPITYAWSQNGVPLSNGGPVSGAADATLTYQQVPLSENGSRFSVTVTDACGSVTSLLATLTVVPDTQPPAVVSATARCLSNQVVVTFSEPVDSVSAGDPANYQVAGAPLVVESAVMLGENEVLLTLPGLDDAEADLVLSVSGVLDLAAAPNVLQPNPSEVPLSRRCRHCGRLFNQVLTCATNPPGFCSWTFAVQNLSTAAVKYVFLASTSACFTVTPVVHNLPTALAPGQSAPLSVTFSNLSAACGPEICLIVSLHDSNVVQCCAFTNCLPNPLAASNQPPVLRCPDPVKVCVRGTNSLLTLTARASDPDGDPLSVEWWVNGVLVSTGSLTLTYPFPLGTHTVQVTVSDGHTSITCTTTVTVLPAPVMTIVRDGKDILLTWTSEGVLQCAKDVTGPWADVPEAVSPYRARAAAVHQFYRVRCPKDE
jgi:hypothetical protein